MSLIRIITLLLLLSCTGLIRSQTHPITAFVNLSPPYSSYLPDYADPFNNQLKILLTLNDFTVPSYQVKLRFKFEGSGYLIQSSDLVGLPPITVTPGVPVEISGSDLAPYLSTSNLTFSGINIADYELRKVLPEGPCSICVEVVDYSNPNQSLLGNLACAQAWFSLNDPPLLNTPICGNEIPPSYPQNLIFSWTPISMGSPYGLSTEYDFELFEIRPEGGDPNMIVNSTLPIFTATTNSTFLNYGIIEPQLQLGMQYVWRVKAREVDGRDIYRNQGYSAVCTFTYGNIIESLADGITLELNAEGIGPRIAKAYWNANSAFTSYRLECRKTGNPDYAWFPYESNIGEITVNSLEPNTKYECRVRGLIGTGFQSEWSNITEFSTLSTPEYLCGSTALPGKQTDIIPLTNLMVGNFVSYGQFDMMITALEELPNSGHYKGYGKVLVPFTLTSFSVKFDDILVDANYMVREGRADALTDGLGNLTNFMDREFINGVIDDVEIDTVLGTVTVYFGEEEQTFDFPENGGPLVIEDSSGLIFIIEPDGGIIYDGNITVDSDVLAATEDYQIYFGEFEDQNFGFDKLEHLNWRKNYGTIILADESFYHVPYKSMGQTDIDHVLAIFRTEGDRSNVNFKTAKGENLTYSIVNDSTYLLNLPSYSENGTIYGYNGSEKIGKLNVKVYQEVIQKLTIVPLLGTTWTDFSFEINATLRQANVHLEIVYADIYKNSDWDLDGDGKMQAPSEVDLLNKYSPEMRALRDSYFSDSSYDKTSAYIFITPSFDNSELDGYMVRGKGMGFVTQEATAVTYTHEISHGLFGLKHTFPEIQQGSTTNLMDYSGPDANHFTSKQWDAIHSPLPSISFLDDEEDGSLYKNGTHVTKICHPYVLAQVNAYSIFYAPDGKLIDLNALPGAKANRFYDNHEEQEYAYGCLNGFLYQGTQYVLAYDLNQNNPFIGYVAQISHDKFEENPIEISPNPDLAVSDGIYVKIDCSSDSVRFYDNLDQQDAESSLYYNCNYCEPQVHSEFFVEGNSDFVDMYMLDKVEAESNSFDNSGTIHTEIRDEINNDLNLTYVDEYCEDRLTAFSIYNEGRQFKIIPYDVSFISRNEADWHLLAQTVFETSNLNEDDILITLPFHRMEIGNLEYTYFMPGLAYGKGVEFDETSLKGIQFDNMISGEDDAVRNNGNIIDFVNHVFKCLKKKVTVFEAVLMPNASISYHTYSSDSVAGYLQNCYIKLFKNEAFDEIVQLQKKYNADAAYGLSMYGDKYTIFDKYDDDSESLEEKYKRLLFNELLSASPLNIEEFTPRESDRFSFKDEFLIESAEEYIFNRAFTEYFQVLNTFDLYSDIPSYEEPNSEYTWNRGNYGWQLLDNAIYTALDVTGIALGFIGLDIITDGLGFAYASCRGDVLNSSVYGASVFIIGVPTVATRTISKALIQKGSKTILRITGDELIGESIEDVIHFYRFKYKSNGSLTAEDILRLIEFEQAGKMNLERTSQFMSASDNPIVQKQILDELGEELATMFNFLDNLEWEEGLKAILKTDIESTPELYKLFGGSDLEKQIDLSEAWKYFHYGGASKETKINPDWLRNLSKDLNNEKYSLSELFEESPEDVIDIWKRLKDDPGDAWEVAKTGGDRWEKWSKREFFKDVTKKGKDFEELICKEAFKNRTSPEYIQLKTKFLDDFGKNLDEYEMFSQVQLKYNDAGDYFVADQIFVKYDDFGDIEDILVIENKLSNSTPLTAPQSNALQSNFFLVRSVSVKSNTAPYFFLESANNEILSFSGSKQWYKVYSNGNGSSITGIKQI